MNALKQMTAKQPDMAGAAKQLAAQGRGDDTHVVHAGNGDLVFPIQRLTPKVLELAHSVLGKDLARFIVGTPQNVINPKTGLAEFDSESGGEGPGAEGGGNGPGMGADKGDGPGSAGGGGNAPSANNPNTTQDNSPAVSSGPADVSAKGVDIGAVQGPGRGFAVDVSDVTNLAGGFTGLGISAASKAFGGKSIGEMANDLSDSTFGGHNIASFGGNPIGADGPGPGGGASGPGAGGSTGGWSGPISGTLYGQGGSVRAGGNNAMSGTLYGTGGSQPAGAAATAASAQMPAAAGGQGGGMFTNAQAALINALLGVNAPNGQQGAGAGLPFNLGTMNQGGTAMTQGFNPSMGANNLNNMIYLA